MITVKFFFFKCHGHGATVTVQVSELEPAFDFKMGFILALAAIGLAAAQALQDGGQVTKWCENSMRIQITADGSLPPKAAGALEVTFFFWSHTPSDLAEPPGASRRPLHG